MSRIGNEEAGKVGRGQFGLLVDHRTGRYLSAVVLRRGDEVLEFNPGDPEAVFRAGDLPLGVGGNLEEARRNAEETLNRRLTSDSLIEVPKQLIEEANAAKRELINTRYYRGVTEEMYGLVAVDWDVIFLLPGLTEYQLKVLRHIRDQGNKFNLDDGFGMSVDGKPIYLRNVSALINRSLMGYGYRFAAVKDKGDPNQEYQIVFVR